MAVQSSLRQQPLEDRLRIGQNVNAETLFISVPIQISARNSELFFKITANLRKRKAH